MAGGWVPSDAILQLRDSKARLGDEAFNSGAYSISRIFRPPDSQFALFSSYVYASSVNPKLRPDLQVDQAYRNAKATQFWNQDVWIVPVNVAHCEHWVLAIVHCHYRRVYIFDSLAASFPSLWREVGQVRPPSSSPIYP